MPKYRYQPGDTLKARVLGSAQPEGSGRIVSELPETHGSVRYRVRFQNENFARSMSQDEIDPAMSPERAGDAHIASSSDGEPSWINPDSWINPNAIRIRK
ncbi:cold-shock protein [Rhizobium sp. ARZ01]|uniref:cold-shock protein n=1 Tax=Rhizobium sp. ARZ01 TaxID=2769313 RepID=UPI00177D8C29|nr:cold-shock protein [Rhizobium sp. ARZ01]MBD9374015.1 cold-shock protein [Rhizobium sp. ARZ01]